MNTGYFQLKSFNNNEIVVKACQSPATQGIVVFRESPSPNTIPTPQHETAFKRELPTKSNKFTESSNSCTFRLNVQVAEWYTKFDRNRFVTNRSR